MFTCFENSSFLLLLSESFWLIVIEATMTWDLPFITMTTSGIYLLLISTCLSYSPISKKCDSHFDQKLIASSASFENSFLLLHICDHRFFSFHSSGKQTCVGASPVLLFSFFTAYSWYCVHLYIDLFVIYFFFLSKKGKTYTRIQRQIMTEYKLVVVGGKLI